jgi:hypothetical protein
VLEYAGTPLEIRIEKPPEDYKLKTLPDAEPMRVTIRWEDPVTGELRPLTEAMRQNMTVTASSESRNAWKLEPGGEAGEWLLTPAYYRGDVLMTESGDVRVTVSASGEDGWLRCSGTGEQTVRLNRLDWRDLIPILLPRLIALAVVLWILIGHLTKKRIRKRGLDPRCHYDGIDSERKRIRKKFLSVVWPSGPEKATVYCCDPNFSCDFPNIHIVATGRRSFRFTDRALPLEEMRINGTTYQSMDDLKKVKFSYGGFAIVSVDPVTQLSAGKFTF